jgi:5-methylcytosine-specific restriction endonuclease McrA
MKKGIRDPSTHRTPEQQAASTHGYKSTPAQIKAREMRNKARQEAIRSGKAHVGDGTSIDHKIPLAKGGSNNKSNLQLMSLSANDRKGTKMGKKK